MKRSMFAFPAALALMGTACSDPPTALVQEAALAAGSGGGGEGDAEFAPYGVGAEFDRQACQTGPHRDFDFWVGRFDMTEVTGEPAGTNRIRRRLDGCLITEHYVGPDGIRGRGLNAYDRSSGEWLQSYVAEVDGTNFRLSGGLVGDQMVMSGPRLFRLPSGGLFPVVDRVTWSPLEERRVNQLIELSTDGGATFPFTLGDFTYTRARPFRPAPLVPTEACSAEEFDQLDYWLGVWTVSHEGRVIGRARVEKDLSNCLIEESFWATRGGEYKVQSFISYDLTTGTWHRTYVDNQGHAFRLEQASAGGSIALLGSRKDSDGVAQEVENVIREDDGHVVQEWRIREGQSETLASFVYSKR